MSVPVLRLGDGIIALLAQLEREHGQARLLRGIPRAQVLDSIGRSWAPTLVIDIGRGRIATADARGGLLRIHEPRTA